MSKPLTVSELARMGGQAKFKKYGVSHYKQMSQKAAEVRKQKKLQREQESQK